MGFEDLRSKIYRAWLSALETSGFRHLCTGERPDDIQPLDKARDPPPQVTQGSLGTHLKNQFSSDVLLGEASKGFGGTV
jgi:hypothetical protein